MKSEEKGFTLVELLVVIGIIAVLSMIIVPIVINYIQSGKDKYNEELKEQLLISGKNYYAASPELLPKKTYLEKNQEAHSYVTLSELASRNLITQEFIDADDRPCTGSYVFVTQPQGVTENEYHACLICSDEEETINYSEDDNYCHITSWNDNTNPTCKANITGGNTKEDIIYNPNTIKLSEVADTDGNVSQIWIKNITTNKEVVIDVKDMTEASIKNIDIMETINDRKLGDGEYTIYVRDGGGNFSEEQCNDVRIVIDNTNPTCTLKYEPVNYTDKNFILEITDNVSLVGKISKVIDQDSKRTGVNYNKESIEKPLKDGMYYGHVKDEAGNEGICSLDVKIKMFEGEEPYCYIYAGSSTYDLVKRDSTLAHKVECYVYQGEQASTDNSKVTAVKDLVDITGITKNSANNNNKENKVVVDINSKVNNTGDGLENINIGEGFVTTKGSSNESIKVQDKDFRVDGTLPTVAITSTSGGSWTKNKIVVTVTATDSYSGIKSIEYSYDNKTWSTASPSNFDTNTTTKKVWTPEYTANQNRTLYIRTTDNAGNVSTVKSTNIKIDKTAPSCTLYLRKDNYYSSGGTSVYKPGTNSSKVYVELRCTDSGSGIKSTSILKDGSATGYTQKMYLSSRSQEGCYSYKATDKVGNVATSSSCSQIKLLPSPPTCKVSKSNTNSTSGVTLTVSSSTATSYKFGSGSYQKSNKKTGVKATTTVTVKDAYGQTGTCKATVSKKTQYRYRSRTSSAVSGYYTANYCGGRSNFYQNRSNYKDYVICYANTGYCSPLSTTSTSRSYCSNTLTYTCNSRLDGAGTIVKHKSKGYYYGSYRVYKCYTIGSWSYSGWSNSKTSTSYFSNSTPKTVKTQHYDTRTVYY